MGMVAASIIFQVVVSIGIWAIVYSDQLAKRQFSVRSLMLLTAVVAYNLAMAMLLIRDPDPLTGMDL